MIENDARNPLIRAAKRGDLLAIKDAIRSGADLNSADSQGWTPLFHAAARGDTEAVRIILEAGADVNHGIETGFTALFAAVMGGRLATVQALVNAGALPRAVQGIELVGYAQGNARPQIRAVLERVMRAH